MDREILRSDGKCGDKHFETHDMLRLIWAKFPGSPSMSLADTGGWYLHVAHCGTYYRVWAKHLGLEIECDQRFTSRLIAQVGAEKFVPQWLSQQTLTVKRRLPSPVSENIEMPFKEDLKYEWVFGLTTPHARVDQFMLEAFELPEGFEASVSYVGGTKNCPVSVGISSMYRIKTLLEAQIIAEQLLHRWIESHYLMIISGSARREIL